ncbi:MAG TPA: hypothetical protein PKL83_01575 [bacterium]|nr:hypothetical protein [bacterium]
MSLDLLTNPELIHEISQAGVQLKEVVGIVMQHMDAQSLHTMLQEALSHGQEFLQAAQQVAEALGQQAETALQQLQNLLPNLPADGGGGGLAETLQGTPPPLFNFDLSSTEAAGVGVVIAAALLLFIKYKTRISPNGR